MELWIFFFMKFESKELILITNSGENQALNISFVLQQKSRCR